MSLRGANCGFVSYRASVAVVHCAQLVNSSG